MTKIISSPLAWIDDDGDKEAIWETASQRLSERSGRTGMGAMSRTFGIPLERASPGEDATDVEVVNIILHEPALTADNLGFKTWASSYMLAKRLVVLRETLLSAIRPSSEGCKDSEGKILELGAGTGLVGIAAAFILQDVDVLLTDLPAIVSNLEKNVRENTLLSTRPCGSVEVGVIDWAHPTSLTMSGESDLRPLGGNAFPVILAADAVYDIEHATLLPNAIAALLAKGDGSRVVIESPLREGFGRERALFRENMEDKGFVVVEEGEEIGFDDWGASASHGEHEGLAEVNCWWSVWKWR